MNKQIKGALAMVLIGSVTFSVSNALLADQSAKLLTPTTYSEDQKPKGNDKLVVETTEKNQTQKRVGNIQPREKMVETSTSTTEVIRVQTKPSNNKLADLEPVLTNKSSSSKVNVTIQQSSATVSRASKAAKLTAQITKTAVKSTPTTTGTSSKPSAKTTATTPPASTTMTNTNSTNTTIPATSTTTTSTNTANTTAQTPPNTPASTTAATTNRGRQVSELAKEKGATQRNNKVNNGKKK